MYINDCQGKEFKLEYCLQIQQGPKMFFNSPGASHQIFQNVNHVPYLLITDNNKKTCLEMSKLPGMFQEKCNNSCKFKWSNQKSEVLKNCQGKSK